jgi:hypothetical protein
MYNRQAAVLLLFFLCLLAGLELAGCGPNRLELFQRLPEQDKELFARTRQFMTERQEERFLEAPDSDARVALVEGLAIHQRLSKFPPHERDAILAQRIVPGMGAEAVLLAWGRPLEIQRRNQDGLALECWHYRRGSPEGKLQEYKVFFVRGLVSEVEP